MQKTQLKKLSVQKFRALNNVSVEFADYITVICGKNGTSKSSILGIAAQIFNFKKNYAKNVALDFRSITGGAFKSNPSDHFRISKTYDTPGSMVVDIEVFDGYTKKDATAQLELMAREGKPRPVVRNNTTAGTEENSSKSFTHPVIFLGLKRLYPIANRDYEVMDFDYLTKNKKTFIGLTNELLNRQSSAATGTKGTISSAVSHGDNYDHESVSAGEDNAGQIVLALMSFRKLKAEYNEYQGGLLLIDEADAGLFPTAQINLLKMLERECRDLNLQVIMTSHSPILIEYAFEQSQKYRQRYKTVYLSNTYGAVKVMQNWSWPEISADIHTRTVNTGVSASLPKVNVYFEDKEAEDFFDALLSRQPIKKLFTPMSNITLGCGNYLQLIKMKIPEFSEKSVVCLDADVNVKVAEKGLKTVVILPGHLPPDQLIFEHLYNLPSNHPFWRNDLQFTRDVLTNTAAEIIRKFNITEDSVRIQEKLYAFHNNDKERKKKARGIFKSFYKAAKIQGLFTSRKKSCDPWQHWIECNPQETNEFLEKLKITLYGVMKNGYAVEHTSLNALVVKLKKVA